MNQVFQEAILSGLYDSSLPANHLTPELLSNDNQSHIWSSLRSELLKAKSFTWAVAFISEDMLAPLKLVLEDIDRKGIKGKIITGTYLSFNSPKVFRELLKLRNVKVLLADDYNFHVKGYLFDHGDNQDMIIGSANFTRNAMLKNKEWSLKISSKTQGSLLTDFQSQLKKLEESSSVLTKEWIDKYAANWVRPSSNVVKKPNQVIKPNSMQAPALEELHKLKEAGSNKALIVSATGTGKTYLGAFAVRDFSPKKFLYLVHRRQIAQKSLNSFKKVLGGDPNDYGLFSGNKKDLNKKYLFATVQTMSQDSVLQELDPKEFDYILIDEAHRVGAPSYKKILSHFKPSFWLGMTATPERMDNQNVYESFDYNLAYEIRLDQALEEKMLTPFHYIGVSDYESDGEVIEETSDLSLLTNEKRVDYVLNELDYYGYCGNQAKGLVFCSRQQEAFELAKLFTEKGHPSLALTNQDTETSRIDAVQQLEDGKLEYIFTVDLFNEGIDIPSLNQIVMLRNTQSSIIFIQQLGRGLRKYPGKKYVTVLDFIGNYKNNYLIPLALTSDRSLSRDRAIEDIKTPSYIDVSTINFSQIASQRIFDSLNKVKLDSMRELRQAYQDLKKRLGHIPDLEEMERFGQVSATAFVKNSNFQSYAAFLAKMGEKLILTSFEKKVLSFMTQELLLGKRPHELLLLKALLENEKVNQEELTEIFEKTDAYFGKELFNSLEKILSLDFFDIKSGKTTKKQQYGGTSLINFKNGYYTFSNEMKDSLQDKDFAWLFSDAIFTGLLLNKAYDNQEKFTLYQKYDRKDACRLLNWPLDVSAPMYGYRVGETETPIFITYKKDDDEKRSAIYNNNFEDGRSLTWYSRSPRYLDSKEIQDLLKPGMNLHVFVKRDDSSGKDFYYLGQAEIDRNSISEEKIGPKKKSTVRMNLVLKNKISQQMQSILFDE